VCEDVSGCVRVCGYWCECELLVCVRVVRVYEWYIYVACVGI